MNGPVLSAVNGFVGAAAEAAAAFVVHAAWQLPFLVGAAALAVRVGRPTAAAANRIWMATLLLCVLLPCVSTVAGYRAARERILQQAQVAVSGDDAFYAGPTRDFEHVPAWKRILRDHADTKSGTLSPFAFSLTPRVQNTVCMLYLCITLAFSGRLFAAWRRSRSLLLAAQTAHVPRHVLQRVHEAGSRMGLRPPPVLATSRVAGPVLAGVLRPSILLPIENTADMPLEELDAVCAHELAHVRRNDPLMNALCSLLFLPVSFHPAAAWADRRIRQTREMACDAEAAGQMDDRQRYARSLLCVAERFRMASGAGTLGFLGLGLFDFSYGGRRREAVFNHQRRPVTTGLQLFGTSGAMEERMHSILEVKQRGGPVRLAAAATLAVFAVVAATTLQVQPALAAQQAQPVTAADLRNAARESPALISGQKVQQQLRKAEGDLNQAEAKSASDEDRKKIAVARAMVHAAQGEIASEPMLDIGTLHPDVTADIKALGDLQVQMTGLTVDLAGMQSPEVAVHFRQNAEAMRRLQQQLNSAEWKARLDAARKIDHTQIEAALAQGKAQREQALEMLRSGAIQRQMQDAKRQIAMLEMLPMGPFGSPDPDAPVKIAASVLAGNVVHKETPAYPKEAKEKHISGVVLLHVLVTETGKVEQADVISSPDPLLSASAVKAVQNWTYKPVLLNGKAIAVDSTVTVTYSFSE